MTEIASLLKNGTYYIKQKVMLYLWKNQSYQLETRDTSNTGTRTLIPEELPLKKLMANEREEISSRSQLLHSEKNKKMSTKVIDETTLRIYFPKKANTEPVTQDLSSPTTSTTAPFKSKIPESYRSQR